MDRSREVRRTTAMAFSNGLSRRRHRTSLRDSPEEDGSMELQDVRLRDRSGSGKKERDRDRDRDSLSQSKRRSNREDDDDETSDESLNHDDVEEGDGGGNGHLRVLPPPSISATSLSSSLLNHSSRRRLPLASTTTASKMFKPVVPWNAADEMIGVPVPRKARSASTKRSHEWLSGHIATGSAAEQIFPQASASPVTTMTTSPVRPVSPSSSNASARKKMKGNGSKPRLPKTSSRSSSSDQDEIEIEIAEVLYGMLRQPRDPSSKHEGTGTDSIRSKNKEESRFSGDAKSQISSPISNSPSAALQPSSSLAQNSSSSVTPPISAIAPKRRKPRPMKYDEENQLTQPVRGSLSSTLGKIEVGQAAKVEAGSPDLDNLRGSAASACENGGTPHDSAAKQMSELELGKSESTAVIPDSEAREGRESGNQEPGAAKDERQSSPMKESFRLPSGDARVNSMIMSKANEIESSHVQKFQIDLMALPSRSSPEVDEERDFEAEDGVPDTRTELKPPIKEDGKTMKVGCGDQGTNASPGDVKATFEFHEQGLYKENNGLQLDMEKLTDNGTSGGTTNSKHNQAIHKQHQILSEKTVQPSNSLTFPTPVAGWPGGLPPMGYMTPLQGVVTIDGSAMAPAAIQSRPKKCATHCYIARNIHFHQQFMRMNLFWPAAAGSASLYGAKPATINAVPPPELSARSGTVVPEKAPNLALFPGTENNTTSATNSLDPFQRKQQIGLQHTLPPGTPSNIMGPAFIFPLSQQHAAAAASVLPVPGTAKAQKPAAVSASTNAICTTSTAAAAASAMSFNYPNMPGGETQYMAILQNNGFPFPVPSHVGAAPTYCSTHAQAMPFFNGSFYSSQMFHSSQLQQQAPIPTAHAVQSVHQNSFLSSGSTSSQKHLQIQQHKKQPQSNLGNGGSLQGVSASSKVQHSQQQKYHSASHHSRLHDLEANTEDSLLSADTRVPNLNFYGQNFVHPIHQPNFTLLSPAQMNVGAKTASGIVSIDKKQQKPQLLGPKATGFDSLPSSSHDLAMSFGSLNSSASASSLDLSSIAPNHTILQSFPEGTRHNYQIFAAAAGAQSTQQKKNYSPSDEGKNGSNDATFEERKTKGSINMGQSIAFSTQDLTAAEATVSLPGSNVVDRTARTSNPGSASGSSSGSVMPAVVNTLNSPQQSQHQQQIMQLPKQHQFVAPAAATRNKNTVTGNVSISMEQRLQPFSSTTAAAVVAAGKSSNVPSPFHQNIGNPSQSPQWKNSPRSTPGVSQDPSSLNSTLSSLKGQTQISFAAADSKGPNHHQIVGQQLPCSSQAPSPPMMVGSPTTSSMSKSAGGSPRTTTTATSTGNKANQASILSTPLVKSSSPSVGGLKSPAVSGAVSSILGTPPVINSSGGTTKHQHLQQLAKQQQHAQLFFTHPYVQVQSPHSTSSSASVPSGYYGGKKNTKPKTFQQQPQSMSATSPVSLVNSSTCDPVKAVAASNLNGGGLTSLGILSAAQFSTVAQTSVAPHQIVPVGFPYIHVTQNALPIKAAEQKQPAREESR